MAHPHFLKLKEFFEVSPVASRAVGPVKTGTTINVHILQTPGEALPHHFLKLKDSSTLREGAAPEPDFSMWISPVTIDAIIGLKTDNVGEFGITFFKGMLREDAERTRVKIDAGVLTLLGHGYLGVLAVGGATVLGWLAQKGFAGVGGLKKAISRLRNG